MERAIVFIVALLIIALLLCLIRKCFFDKDKDLTLADQLIGGGLDIIIATVPTSSETVIQFLYDALQIQKTATDGGLAPILLYVTGAVVLVVGVVLKIRESTAKYVVFNMPGTIHHTKDDYMQQALKTNNCDEIETITATCQGEMQKLSQTRLREILRDIDSQMNRFNSEKRCKRGFTGMAPIPFILYAGTKHKGSDVGYYIEFDKATQQYTVLNAKREYPKLLKPSITGVTTTEIVVAVSTTAIINEANTSQFSCPVSHLRLATPKDNAIFSKKQLDDYVNETVTFLSEMCKKNSQIKRIHLLLATQACFTYALGKSLVLMQNRVPQIVSYHYIAPSYKVGVVVNSNQAGTIVKLQE